jgi:hypothetical protein
LEQLAYRQDELERELNKTDSQSESAKTVLSQQIGSIAISDILFNIAEASEVTVIELNSAGIGSEELAGVACSVLPLNAKVEGELTALVNYITTLNSNLPTGIVKSVEISIAGATSNKASANIQLVVYGYRGG